MGRIFNMQGQEIFPPNPWEITIILDADTEEQDIVNFCNSLIMNFNQNKIDAEVSYGRLGEEPENEDE